MSVTSTLSSDSKTATLKIEGRFDFSVHRQFREAYRAETPTAQYLVDLGQVDYMDSAALGMLLLLREHTEAKGLAVRIINCTEQPRQAIEIAQFSKFFEVSDAA